PIDIQQGGTDAISESQTNEIPSQESSGAVQEMETEVRNESTAPQETGQGEQGQVTPKKKAPTLKELVSSPEARQFRASELLDRINQYRRENTGQGIARDDKKRAAYWRDVTDYAAIRILDGAITTVRQLAAELGITQSPDLNKAWNAAKRMVDSDIEGRMTTARNADTARKRAELGFNERLPFIAQPTSEVEAQAREAIESGYDVGELIDRAVNGGVIDAVETSILAQYSAAQEAKIMEASEQIESKAASMSAIGFQELVGIKNRAMDNLQKAYDALEASGTMLARAMNMRKALVYRDLSLANMLSDMKIAKGNVKLTDAEMENIRKRYKEMSDLAERMRERNTELEEENARLNALILTEQVQKDIEAANRRKNQRSPQTKKEAIESIRKRREEALIPELKEALRGLL